MGEFVDTHELGRDKLALRRAVTEAGECLLLHVEQGRHRETRVWRGSGVGLTLEGSEGVELCALGGSTMVIVIKQNNWRQSRGA